MSENPLLTLLKEAAKAARRKKLDEIFVFVDPKETPLTAGIRDQGDEGDDLVRGIILTLAALEKRLPPDRAA